MSEDAPDQIADIVRNGRMENIFPTPIFSHVLDDCDGLNAELRTLILERERTTPTATKSNLGGWQSAPDFFRWGGSAVATLERYVRCALDVATVRITAPQCLRGRYDLYGWGAVNRRGHYNAAHLHPMATWSGVYYVDPGDADAEGPGGLLEFVHPVPAAAMAFFPNVLPSARLVRPQAGMVILFPSYLLHGVRMYLGDRPRICVPFNAHLQSIARADTPAGAA